MMRFEIWLLLLVSCCGAFAKSTDGTVRTPTLLIPINGDLKRFVEIVDEKYPWSLAKYEINQNILRAALLFDALGSYGIRYERSSKKSDFFARLAQEDSVYLIPPLKVFSKRRGNAQQLAILFAAVLEARGIPTALLNASNHPLILFDTGIHKNYSGMISKDVTSYTIINNHLWFAVEVAKLGKPLWEAWRSSFGKISRRPFVLIPVLEIFRTENSQISNSFETVLETSRITELVAKDKKYFESKNSQANLNKVAGLMKENNKKSLLYFNRGIQHLNRGAYDDALFMFKKAADYGADLGKALFMMAKAFGEKQDYGKMKRTALKLIQFNKRDPRGYKILGLAHYYSGELVSGEQFLSKAKFLENNVITAAK